MLQEPTADELEVTPADRVGSGHDGLATKYERVPSPASGNCAGSLRLALERVPAGDSWPRSASACIAAAVRWFAIWRSLPPARTPKRRSRPARR